MKISKEQKSILLALQTHGDRGLRTSEIAAEIVATVDAVRQIVYRLVNKSEPLVFRDNRHRYFMTDLGRMILDDSLRSPGTTACQWISDVRLGMTSDGHETHIRNAKTPSCQEIRQPAVLPIEEIIDAYRALYGGCR